MCACFSHSATQDFERQAQSRQSGIWGAGHLELINHLKNNDNYLAWYPESLQCQRPQALSTYPIDATSRRSSHPYVKTTYPWWKVTLILQSRALTEKCILVLCKESWKSKRPPPYQRQREFPGSIGAWRPRRAFCSKPNLPEPRLETVPWTRT